MKKLLFEELLLEYNKAYMYSWINDKDIVDRFWKIKKLLGNRQEADINWWVQNKMPKDFEEFVNDYEMGKFKTNTQIKKSEKLSGAQAVYDDHKYWRVYFVTSYEAAKQLGRHTKWCITGHNDEVSEGEYYFNKYIEDTDLKNNGYYFCFDLTDKSNHGDYRKYCVLVKTNNQIDSIWDETDEKIKEIPVSTEAQAIQFISDVILPYDIYDQNHFITTYAGWDILDKKEDRILLLFDKFLDDPDKLIAQPYNKDDKTGNINWASSDLRKWLSSNLSIYFTAEEQQKLIPTRVMPTRVSKRPDVDQGPETVDKMFLLSASEVLAFSQRCKEENKKTFSGWPYATWLRSVSDPLGELQTAMFTYRNTVDVVGQPMSEDTFLVRPACWFKIK